MKLTKNLVQFDHFLSKVSLPENFLKIYLIVLSHFRNWNVKMDNSNKMNQHSLPPKMWGFIFCHLDASSLKKISETSKVFHEIVSRSENLSTKLTLRLEYPQDMNSFADCILKTKRKYRKLAVSTIRDHCIDEFDQHKATLALQKLGLTVKELRIDWSNVQRRTNDQVVNLAAVKRRRTENSNSIRAFHSTIFGRGQLNEEAPATAENIREDTRTEFLNVIRYFPNIVKLTLINVNLETDRQEAMPEIQYQHLKELVLNRCNSFIYKLLMTVTYLEKKMCLILTVHHEVQASMTLNCSDKKL